MTLVVQHPLPLLPYPCKVASPVRHESWSPACHMHACAGSVSNSHALIVSQTSCPHDHMMPLMPSTPSCPLRTHAAPHAPRAHMLPLSATTCCPSCPLRPHAAPHALCPPVPTCCSCLPCSTLGWCRPRRLSHYRCPFATLETSRYGGGGTGCVNRGHGGMGGMGGRGRDVANGGE